MPVVSKARIQYLVGGLLIGGFWYLNRHHTPADEAFRTIAVFAVIMIVMRARLKSKGVDVHLLPLLAAKAALIVIAALVEEGLKNTLNNPAVVVSIGLGLVVALLGPLGDRRFFTRTPPTSTSTPTTVRSAR